MKEKILKIKESIDASQYFSAVLLQYIRSNLLLFIKQMVSDFKLKMIIRSTRRIYISNI